MEQALKIAANLILTALGGSALYFSLQMTLFGIIQSPMDQNELSPDQQYQSVSHVFAGQCSDWTNVFGYRLICRKVIADDYFRSEFKDINDERAETVLDQVLMASAFEPAYYVMKARVGLYKLTVPEQILPLLRLSYISGRGEQSVMIERFRVALALWPELDESDKSIALNDYLRTYSPKREELYQLLLTSSEDIQSDILRLVVLRDPATYSRFLQDLQVAKQ